jgi:hypothetical protein
VTSLDPVRVRRAWAARWCLSAPARLETAADGIFALHATDPATLVLSAWARTGVPRVEGSAAALKKALETDRSLVRVLAMRRTLHVVPRRLVPALLAVYRERLAAAARKNAGAILAGAGCRTSLDVLAAKVAEALTGRDATVTELAADVPELAMKFTFAEGKAYGGTSAVGGRVVDAIGILGHVIRARSRGGWKTSQCSWARVDDWLPGLELPDPREGAVTVVRAYLEAFGPATADDLAWWTGLPKAQTKAAITVLGKGVSSVEVAGWPGVRLVLRDRLDDLDAERPDAGVCLLPALDPSIMGHAERTVLDPAHRPLLFDRSGNAGPTVWADGRVIGGWGMPKAGGLRFRLLDGAEREAEVVAAAERLSQALGGERVAPRFPVPIGKELG